MISSNEIKRFAGTKAQKRYVQPLFVVVHIPAEEDVVSDF